MEPTRRSATAPERWGSIEQLFNKATELSAAEREALLCRACAGDDDLRQRVATLLAAHDALVAQAESDGGFLEQLDAERAGALLRPAEEMPAALRQALGERYVVERRLASGGMADVFTARDIRHDRLVAIKIVRQDSTSPQLEDHFEREVRIAARLQHPHIIPLYDSGIVEGHRYHVMPFVAGPTLRQRLQESGRFPVADVLAIVDDVAGALDYAHASGIVHRDIKPENILLSAGRAVVVDFGIARPVVETNGSTTLTGVGIAVGTPAYMSPEQAAGERVVDGRCDQYALACVAYELLTGQPLFTGASALQIIAQHFGATLPPLALDEVPDVPASRALIGVMTRALAREPAGRFATSTEFATALGAASRQAHGDAPRPAEVDRSLPGNLTSISSPLIGREEAAARAGALLSRPEVRLVTFTGTGGTGKTRLALEVCRQLRESFEGGVWVVPLAQVSDHDLVPSAIGHVLELQDQGSDSLLDTIARYVAGRRLLLLLDNFEQVVGAAPWLGEVLARAPTLTILVTSRVLLRVQGEHDFPVPPLDVPDLGSGVDVSALAGCPSVRLFTERARSIEPAFALTDDNAAAVAEICVRLDGLPLAIELAAARVNLLSPREILGRLEHRMRLLTRGARDLPQRHQTLRHAIGWSYDLLADAARRLFGRLSVFAGGFTVDAAEAVCDVDGTLGIDVLDGIDVLLDANLLQRDGSNGGRRLRMLETIREFAIEVFARDPASEPVRDHHRDWCLELGRRARPNLIGAQQDSWLRTLSSEHANLRVALERTLQSGDVEKGLSLGVAIWRYWLVRGHAREGLIWLDRALALPMPDAIDPLRADALTAAGTLAQIVSELDGAALYLSRALELRRRSGDQTGEARALADLGWLAWRRCEYPDARQLSHESLAVSRVLDNKALMASAFSNLGWIAMFEGDYDAANAALEEGLALRRELSDRRGVAYMLMSLEWVASKSGNNARALSLADEVLPIFREIGDIRLYAAALSALARASLALGDASRARSLLELEVLPIMRQTGDPWNTAAALCVLSNVMREQGDYARAKTLAAESLDLRRVISDRAGIAESERALEALSSETVKS